MRAAGIDPASVRKRRPNWTEGGILDALRGAARDGVLRSARVALVDAARHWLAQSERQARGQPINAAAVQASDYSLANAIQRHMKSHDEALRAAGINPPVVPGQRCWDQATVIAALRERKHKGLAMNVGAIAKSDVRLSGAMHYHFDSYAGALRAAGIDPEEVRKRRGGWTEEQLLAALRGVARNGALPWPLEASAGVALVDAARYRFGSIKAAAEAAGLRYHRPGGREIGHWTGELVLQTLRDLHRDGHDLRHRFMKEHSQPLFFAAKEFFGSYVNAVRQAGIDYWQMSQTNLARERAAAAAAAG